MRHEDIIDCGRGISDRSAYALLLYLSLRAGNGTCFVKQSTISSDTGMSERVIRCAIRKLEDLGKLTVVRSRINHYHIQNGGVSPVRKPITSGVHAPIRNGVQPPDPQEHKEEQVVVEEESKKIIRRTTKWLIQRLALRAPSQIKRADRVANLVGIHGEAIRFMDIVEDVRKNDRVHNKLAIVEREVKIALDTLPRRDAG